MFKLNIKGVLLSTLVSMVALPALADDAAVDELEAKVNERVAQLEAAGFLPTYNEIELIKVDMVDEEIVATGISVEEAIAKYELPPVLERLVKIKEAVRIQGFAGGLVVKPPKEPTNDGNGGG